jgi:hypothetical protein
MPLVDFDSGILMTTVWLLFYLFDPATFQPMDDGLKPFAFHHQVHVSLGLGEAAFNMYVRGVRPSGSRRSGMGMLARERGAAERESSDGHPDCCVKRWSHLCLLG